MRDLDLFDNLRYVVGEEREILAAGRRRREGEGVESEEIGGDDGDEHYEAKSGGEARPVAEARRAVSGLECDGAHIASEVARAGEDYRSSVGGRVFQWRLVGGEWRISRKKESITYYCSLLPFLKNNFLETVNNA